jgi:ATP-dependent RNA helicase HelY
VLAIKRDRTFQNSGRKLSRGVTMAGAERSSPRRDIPPRSGCVLRRGKKKQGESHRVFMKPEIDPALKNILAKIGKPEEKPFVPDAYQQDALAAIKETDCLVIAPTGSGKTWIAREAILSVLEKGGRAWYASPLKALTNSKWVEFGLHFEKENVGIITGDTKENTEAPIIVGTTEILRNQLYDAMHQGYDLGCDLVILDEAHFLGDIDRGVVWEEVMTFLPARVNLLLLSATIGNGDEIAAWLETIRKKKCVVIKEEQRPVPLYPLFLHPSGRLLPLLEDKKFSAAVTKFLGKESGEHRSRRYMQPDYGGIIRILEQFNLLPAIFFLKSRAECDAALKSASALKPLNQSWEFSETVNELLRRYPALQSHRQWKILKTYGLSAHHGGQLPAWKFVVEAMMKEGHLRVIFATSTIAAGVNFPARTIVLFNSDLYNGHNFNPMNATEFRQMTGRAGRRGQDKIGFMLAVNGRFMDLSHIRRLLFREAEDILSQLKNDFVMVLNLLLSHTPSDIRSIFEKSLASYQQTKRRPITEARAAKTIWEDFSRHLEFLKAEGFVDKEGRLTEDGHWAAKLRLDQPLLVAECLRKNSFPEENEKLLAAIVSMFAYDRDNEISVELKNISPKLLTALKGAITAVRPLAKRLDAAGFGVSPLYPAAGAAMYSWANGRDWDILIKTTGMAEGDLATLVLRTADNLRQIGALKDTHPVIAASAYKARELILREPVLFV